MVAHSPGVFSPHDSQHRVVVHNEMTGVPRSSVLVGLGAYRGGLVYALDSCFSELVVDFDLYHGILDSDFETSCLERRA